MAAETPDTTLGDAVAIAYMIGHQNLMDEIRRLQGLLSAAEARALWFEKQAYASDARAEQLTQAVIGARLQIEYLHEKFQETGSGNAVLARINVALAARAEPEGEDKPHE